MSSALVLRRGLLPVSTSSIVSAASVKKLHLATSVQSSVAKTDLVSQWAGVLSKSFCQPGQHVKKGERLFSIESMKMSIPVDAHTSGTIVAVNVKANQMLKRGDVLLTIDPSTGEPLVSAALTTTVRNTSSTAGDVAHDETVGDVLVECERLPRPQPTNGKRFSKILVANRGEIARRIMRSAKQLGVQTVAVYSTVDENEPFVKDADEAVRIGDAPATSSYLRADKIVRAALKSGAQGVHPGYGFLSENPELPKLCERFGLRFIGPTASNIEQFGRKHTSRQLALKAAVPIIPGTEPLESVSAAISAAATLHYPVLLKLVSGGGGIGMYVCHDDSQLREAFESARAQGKASFNDERVYLEKYIERARHIEVQCVGDGAGTVVHLGERECTMQRRHQKVIEEAPSPRLSDALRAEMHATAVRLLASVNYLSAGTVEFVYDDADERFYFLEVNTRLQVEHGVSELVTRIDIVQWMLDLAAGVPATTAALRAYRYEPRGHAIEMRILAEHPFTFLPAPGRVERFRVGLEHAPGVRLDAGVSDGSNVTPFYDSMIGKLLTYADTRSEALRRALAALDSMDVQGIVSNRALVRAVLTDAAFVTYSRRLMATQFLSSALRRAPTLEVLDAGMNVSVQDYPARVGYWSAGVPPSGPMDHLTARLVNAVLGNDERAAVYELLLLGGDVRWRVWHASITVCIGGPAALRAVVVRSRKAGSGAGESEHELRVPLWTPITVRAGDVLRVSALASDDVGMRAYIAVAGGIDVPEYLGSRATFAHGSLGGLCGRALSVGDFLPVVAARTPTMPTLRDADERDSSDDSEHNDALRIAGAALPATCVPAMPASGVWVLRVLLGPHAAPDYFTTRDVERFFDTEWSVSHQSNRLGMRLEGASEWQFARRDGGEGGTHPSNVVDCVYAVGSINFTGNTPIVLTQDGPSLGGFVCIATIVHADLWMIGQARAGDRVRFVPITLDEAECARREQDRMIDATRQLATTPVPSAAARLVQAQLPVPSDDTAAAVDHQRARWSARRSDDALLLLLNADSVSDSEPRAEYRAQGESRVLVEYGDARYVNMVLRARVHLLMERLRGVGGIIELSPGVRSLQVHFDADKLPRTRLLALLERIERAIGDASALSIACRTVHLPMAFDDSGTRRAIEMYSRVIRAQAPYLPDNIDFIARCCALPSRADVERVMFAATYAVMGLGDVYLSAPCAVALDPRQRFNVPKYNPARVFTPEGTVGFGGSNLCIYGMDSPGGYQLVGRTLAIWNTYQTARRFKQQPWFLQNWDMIKFHSVSENELNAQRAAWRADKLDVDIKPLEFKIGEYAQLMQSIESEVREQRARTAAAAANACKGL